MTILTQAPNGTSGVTVTPANSAPFGNQWDQVNGVSAGGIVAYDNTELFHGRNSVKILTASGAGSLGCLRWSTSMGTQSGAVYGRFYVNLGAYPATPGAGWRLYSTDATSTNCASLHILSNGTIDLRDSSATTVLVSGITAPLNQWIRIEFFVLPNATAGQGWLALYVTDPDSPTPDWQATSTATQAFTGPSNNYVFGVETTTVSAGPFWFSDMALSTVGPIGASVPEVTTASLPGGTVGSAYSAPLAAAGGTSPYTWAVTAGSLPGGLSLSSGVISGTPSTAGSSSFTVQATDVNSLTATAPLSIVIAAAGHPVFPDAPLGLRAELDLGNAWTDISASANHSAQDSQNHPAAVVITRGRADETTTTANPSGATFEIDNRDGKFSGRNPLSPFYGLIGRNTPVRWSVPAPVKYLRLQEDKKSYSQAQDAAGLDITGDLDIRLEFDLTDWTGGNLAGKWDTDAAQQSWLIQLVPDGTVTFFWSTNGTDFPRATSTSPIPLGHHALKITLDVNNGASGNTVTFYTGTSITLNDFTQLGNAVVQAGTTSIFSSTSNVVVGDGCSGSFFKMNLRNGIGGTLVASPDFTAATAGASSLTDGQGNSWALGGSAAFSDRDYRVHAEMSSLPVTWDETGNDVWTQVTAAGILRRLQQGQQPPIMSSMRRALQFKTGSLAPVAYWSCEDAAGSVTLASAIGGKPMTITGAPQLASDTNFDCSNPIPVLSNASFQGAVPRYSGNAFVLRFLMDTPVSSTAPNQSVIARVFFRNPTVSTLTLRYGTGGALELTGWDSTGSNLFDLGPLAFNVEGKQMWVSLELQKVASTVQYSITTMEPNGAALSSAGHLTIGNVGTAWGIQINPGGAIQDIAIGHISVQGTWESLFDDQKPLNAWNGEAAGNRFARLCTENGITGRVYGYPDETVAMGPQVPDSILNLLQQCEDADRGQIYEPREVLGLAYRTLASMCSQNPALTLDYSQDQLTPPLTPTDDDLYTVNDVTVTNAGGSSARSVLDDGSPMSISAPGDGGTGDYANTYDVSVASDDQLADEAGWILRTGTVDQERYPNVVVNLASTQSAVSGIANAVAAVDIGDFVEIVNTPAFLPPGPVDQLAWGSTETLGDFCREIEWNTIPEAAYEVGIVSDTTSVRRVDTDGSTLYAPIGNSDTTLHVATGGSMITGAWLDSAAMGATDIGAAITLWNGWTGGTPALSAIRDYSNGLSDFVFHTRYTTETAAGEKLCLDLAPAYNPVSSADLTALDTLLAAMKASGISAEISLWHEPFFSGLTADQYIAMIQFYGPTVRKYYPLVFVTSMGSVFNNNENSYYAGDDWFDKVATDYYSINFENGHFLDLAATIADSANPPKPFGLWEFNALVAGANWLVQPNSGFEPGSIGTWTGAGNDSIALSTAQAHSGTHSLALTSAAAGNMDAAHCTAATIATNGLPCSPGDSISTNAWFRAATVARSVRGSVTFYTSAGTLISTLTGTSVTDSTTTFTLATATVTAPATAAFCRAQPSVLATGAAGEVHYVDDVTLSNLATGYTTSQVTDFFNDIQSYFKARGDAGLVNADLLLFNGHGVNSTLISQSLDPRIADFQAVAATGIATMWTTDPSDLPFDIEIGGERMTVTGISGSASQVFTVTRSVNGIVKSHNAGESVSLPNPAVAALT